jgi:hypothetical protein
MHMTLLIDGKMSGDFLGFGTMLPCAFATIGISFVLQCFLFG